MLVYYKNVQDEDMGDDFFDIWNDFWDDILILN